MNIKYEDMKIKEAILIELVKKRKVAEVLKIIKNWVNVNKCTRDKGSLILWAIHNKDKEMCEILVKSGSGYPKYERHLYKMCPNIGHPSNINWMRENVEPMFQNKTDFFIQEVEW